MKKILVFLLIPLVIYASDISNKLGFQFGTSSSPFVGVKYHVNNWYAVGTSVQVELNRDTVQYGRFEDGTYSSFDKISTTRSYFVLLENQFYLPPIKRLDHFLNVDIGYNYTIEKIDAVPNYKLEKTANTLLGYFGYGVEFFVNDHISLWGKLNLTAASFATTEVTEDATSDSINGEITERTKDRDIKFISLEQSAVGITLYIL